MVMIMDNQRDGYPTYAETEAAMKKGMGDMDRRLQELSQQPPHRTVEQIRRDFTAATNWSDGKPFDELVEELCRAMVREEIGKITDGVVIGDLYNGLDKLDSRIGLIAAEVKDSWRTLNAEIQEIKRLTTTHKDLCNSRWTDLDARVLNCQQELQRRKSLQSLQSCIEKVPGPNGLRECGLPDFAHLGDIGHTFKRQPSDPQVEWCCDDLRKFQQSLHRNAKYSDRVALINGVVTDDVVRRYTNASYCPFCGVRRSE